MTSELTIAIAIVICLALGVHFYAKLLTTLRWRHRILWEGLGRPKFMMASVDRLVRLQSFIFSGKALRTGDKDITTTVVYLRIFALLLVVGIAAVVLAIGRKFLG